MLLVACSIASIAAVTAQAGNSSATAVTRPTVKIVKSGLIKQWDTDRETSVDKIQLVFKSVRLLPTRKAVPYRDFVEPGKSVTPVSAVFNQAIRTNSYCVVYRWNFTGIFWQGDYGWTFKNRDVTYKRIADSC